jgi:hypothetical protein
MLRSDLTSEKLWTAIDKLRPEDFPAILTHPQATEMHIVKILARKDISENFLQIVGRSQWMKYPRVQFYFVNNPKTPPAEAMNFVRLLFWRDLNFVLTNLKLASEVRHLAESVVIQRLPTMAVGDKITLARITAGEVLKTMRSEKDSRIINALLQNPRMTEEDVLFIVNQPKTPAPVLEVVAKSSKWACRKEVKIALIRNSSTPIAYAIGLISGLLATDLKMLVSDQKVKVALRKMMETKLKGQK